MGREKHTIFPVYDKNSAILVLGSFPSVKSRECGFFYGHPQNRFWKVIAYITQCNIPDTIDQKKEMLIKNKIALWDVIKSCEIKGSSDSYIKNETVNNLSEIIAYSPINRIFLNGSKAYELFKKLCSDINLPAVKLPSTSPANAAYSTEKLINDWRQILEYIKE